jgi:outer membrane protein TolC
MMSKRIIFFGCLMWCLQLNAQTPPDSSFLNLDKFMGYLKNYHPILQKYRLLNEQAKQQVMQSKGQFDPSIKARYEEKNFEDKNYYNDLNGLLKIPTWYGPDFKLGFENNSGQFINPENQTPNDGLLSAGFSLPIGQGLIINERLATLKQAKIFVKIADADRIKFINKFLFTAIKNYWEWYLAFNKLKQYNESFGFANQRYSFTVQRSLQGDLAPIDTVEASIQRQNMLLLKTNASVEFYNATMQLNNFLWKDETTPLELEANVYPSLAELVSPKVITDTLQGSLSWGAINNPELQKLRFKIEQLDVEKRFARNKLLPKFNLDYAFLSDASNFSDSKRGWNTNNNKLGGSFAMPLLLRSERGKLNQTKLKLLEANYDLQQSNKELDAGLKSIAFECNGLWQQLGIQLNVVNNSERLRNAEKVNFDNGESSLFLINTRETNLLNSQIKYFEMINKYQKSKAFFYTTLGNLSEVYGIR